MKTNKWILWTAAVLLLALLAAGCSNTGGRAAPAGGRASSVSQTAAASSRQRVFTLSELKKYNGQNGAPAYVAVNGVVYDVSNVKEWKNGAHHGYQAGRDLTKAIQSAPHGTSVLKGLPVVGTLQ